MRDNLIIALTMVVIAIMSIGVSKLFSFDVFLVYLVGLILWVIAVEVWYRNTDEQKSQ